MSIRYRPEIDGLRTIAVGSVLIYHLKAQVGDGYLFPGGFLGVDVFFVISGYLITAILLREIAGTGRISVAKFYERRARRILPALFLVMAGATVVAFLLLTPSELKSYIMSLLASTFFVSNMYWFWELGGYGSQDGLYQPFLHTWSLAVEEQFYIFFPIFCLALFKLNRKLILPALLALFVFGLIGAQIFTGMKPQLSFFWLPSRVWELVAGAILAELAFRNPTLGRGRLTDAVMPWLGLALILGPILFVPLTSITHPGFATLPAVMGPCLLIWFADRSNPVIRMLASRPVVAIGLISYALYLWHYPIYAFGRRINPEPGWTDYLIWVALSLALAALSTHLIEKPFRDWRRMPLPRFAMVAGAALAVLLVGTVLVQTNNGYPGRLDRLAGAYGPATIDNEQLREDSWTLLEGLAPGREALANEPSTQEMQNLWFSEGLEKKILVIGNSHSKGFYNAFHMNADAYPDLEFARFGMGPELYPDQVRVLWASPNFAAADEVMLAFRYQYVTLRRLPALIEQIKARGKTVVLVNNTAEFREIGPYPLFDWYVRETVLKEGKPFSVEDLERLAWENRDPVAIETNARLAEIAVETGVAMIDRAAMICDETTQRCRMVTSDGHKMFFDYGHLTLEGAQDLGQRMAVTFHERFATN